MERLLQDYQGIEGLAEAKKLLSQILSRPERKEALARRKVGEEAESAFAKARDLETSGDLPRAVLAYRVVAEKFSGTVAADNAKERLEELDKNPALQNEVRQQKTDKDCKSWLSLAENYARARMKAKAREYLEKILSTYPESSHAETARERLDQLSP